MQKLRIFGQRILQAVMFWVPGLMLVLWPYSIFRMLWFAVPTAWLLNVTMGFSFLAGVVIIIAVYAIIAEVIIQYCGLNWSPRYAAQY